MKKRTVPFIKIPHERNPALLSVSIFCRGLAMELYMFGCNYSESGYDPAPIPVYGNWHVCLAKLLQVDARERANFARMLDRLVSVGVLVAENGFVSVHYSAPKRPPSTTPSEPTPPPVRGESEVTPSVVRGHSVGSPSVVRQDLTPRNDSTHVSQIREEKIRIEERENARAPDADSDLKVGNDFMLNATGLHWQMAEQELQLIGARPEPERLRALAAIRSDPWCQANMRKCSPKHVLRKWNDYSSGSTKMQLVAAKPPELAQTELQKLYAKYTELSKAERECQFFEADKKARIQARIAEVSSQIKAMKESDGKPQAQPA